MSPTDASGSIKLLTLNLHKGFAAFSRRFVLHELREAVRLVDADVVFLQEVVGAHTEYARSRANWPLEPQYQFLAGTIWGSYAYGRNAVYAEGHHGNALLSKAPISHFHNHDVSVGTEEGRGLLHSTLKVGSCDQPVHTVCVHLGLQEEHRKRQTELLCELVRDVIPAGAPLLIAGDFNDWRGRVSAALRHCGNLTEAFTAASGHPARTFPVWLPIFRLDRVYFRNLELMDTRVCSRSPWSRLSDHAALFAHFRFLR